MLDLMDFMLLAQDQQALPGQQEWWLGRFGTSTDTFVVPDGVTQISAVIVGGAYTQIRRGSTVLLSGVTALGSGVGGGNGGTSGSGDSTPGGGGAGGYSGNGGQGGNSSTAPAPTSHVGTPGSNGSGGGGGGGGGRQGSGGAGGSGGGVGLRGQGGDGTGGAVNTSGSSGSSSNGGSFYGGANPAKNGANLRWKNDIPVTPGETLILEQTVDVTASHTTAARIMWGGGRSYPNNALDM